MQNSANSKESIAVGNRIRHPKPEFCIIGINILLGQQVVNQAVRKKPIEGVQIWQRENNANEQIQQPKHQDQFFLTPGTLQPVYKYLNHSHKLNRLEEK
jgi:hypothetical protein